METKIKKIYHKHCDICGRLISSLSEQQFAYNYKQHYESCKKRMLRQVNQESKCKQ